MKFARRLLIVLVLLGVAALVLSNYSLIFTTKVIGEVIEIERPAQPSAIIGANPNTSEALFSYAIAIKTKTGEIFTASSEDRQWAAVKKGYCVEAIYYPYPPWNLDKAGTFFNARLKKLMICDPAHPQEGTPTQ